MAEADWTVLSDGISTASLKRNVTPEATPPPGGGSFTFGFNSLDLTVGASGLFVNLTNFAPMAKGGRITGAIQRGLGGGPTGFAPMFFIGLQGPSVNDQGYLLGLGDEDPAHIVLKKGTIVTGLADLAPAPPSNGILRRSTKTVAIGEWLHLRLDMVVNLTGDVVLKVFENDLDTNPLSGAPVWTAITGMDDFIDDNLQVATGSAPFTSGRAGNAFYTEDVTRRGYIDHVTLERQL
jgi:hypothetical protein